MNYIKIIIYIVLLFLIIQTIRQTINIIKYKLMTPKCIDYETKRIMDKKQDILLLGDSNILGQDLFNCKHTINNNLSVLLKQYNIHTIGKQNLLLKDLQQFIKSNWFDLSKLNLKYIFLSIGSDDIMSRDFDLQYNYLNNAIKLLNNLTTNIYILGPTDLYNDKLFVMPFNYFIQYRTKNLIKFFNQYSNELKYKFIDIIPNFKHNCQNGKFCRTNNGIYLDTNASRLYAVIINHLVAMSI